MERPVDDRSVQGYIKAEHKGPSDILRYFTYAHLPLKLQAVSANFHTLALIIEDLPNGAEKSTALRKLLEAKDAAVRAALDISE